MSFHGVRTPIGSGVVTSGIIASGQVGWPHLASGAVRSGDLGITAGTPNGTLFLRGDFAWAMPPPTSGGVGSGSIASGAVQGFFGSTRNIASGTVGVFDFGSGAVIAGAVGSGAVRSGNIVSGSVSSFDFEAGGIFSGNISSGVVGTNALGSGAANSGHMSSGALHGSLAAGARDIASGTIGPNDVASDGVLSGNIASGVIGTNALGPGSVTSNTITSGIVYRFLLSSGAVNSGAVNSGAVLGSLGGGAINIASGTIGPNDIGDGTVTSGAIASGQIGPNHLGSGAVLSGAIGSGQVGQFAISSGAITSGLLGATGTPTGANFLRDDFSWQPYTNLLGQTSGNVVLGNIASGQIGSFHFALSAAVTYARNLIFDQYTTTETISGVRCAMITESGRIQIAMAAVSGRMPATGVVFANALSGALVTVVRWGNVLGPVSAIGSGLCISGRMGRSLWVGASGQVVTISGGGPAIGVGGGLNANSGAYGQFIGRSAASGGVLIDIVPSLLLSGAAIITTNPQCWPV